MSEGSDQLNEFIQKARARHVSDSEIGSRLTAAGWSESEVRSALEGDDLAVPLPPPGHRAQHIATHHKGEDRPTISALQAALQHVLLWVFTLMSAIMISVVAFTLFDSTSVGSSDSLLTYVVLELVTFAPFAFFYWQYLRQLGKQPDLMTGKVWSIITIVLHSVGLIGSMVAFILVIVLAGDQKTPGLVSSGMIALMNALVVTAYVWANFAKSPQSSARIWYLRLFPVALFALISVLGVIALMRVGPLRADDQTRQDLVTTVTKVYTYTGAKEALPGSQSDLSGVPEGVTYERLNSTQYQVCAIFQKASDDGVSYSKGLQYDESQQYDDYATIYAFSNVSSGENCWTFTSSVLAPQAVPRV